MEGRKKEGERHLSEPLVEPKNPTSNGQPSSKACLTYMCFLSISFLLCFTAFSAVQNLESSLTDHLGKVKGPTAVAIIYIVFTFSCLLGPSLVATIGPKMCIICQEVVIGLFIASQIKPEPYTVYPAAALLGFGSSAMWVAQGDYTSYLSSTYARREGLPKGGAAGLFQGIFFAFFQFSQVSGNLVSSLVLHRGGHSSDPSDRTVNLLLLVYIVCVGASIVVVALLLPTKSWLLARESRDESADGEEQRKPEAKKSDTISATLLDTVKLMVNPKMALLIPLFIANGLESGFIWGDFTSSVVKRALGEANIGFMMVVYGVLNAVFSLLLGRVSDKVGRPVVFIGGFLCHMGCSVALMLWDVPHHDNSTRVVALIVALAAVWGIGDAVWNTLISALLSAGFPDDVEAAFSNFKMFQSAGIAAAFFYSDHLSFNNKLIILMSFLVAGIVCYFVDVLMFRVEEAKKKS